MLVRKVVDQMVGYVPGEQPQDRRYIKLNTNENPYPPSPRVYAALQAAAADDLRLYPDPVANTLRDRAATVYGVTRDNILAGNGSDELLSLIMKACVGPGDRVVYPYPTYSLYDTLVHLEEGEVRHIPFGADYSLPAGLVEAGGKVTIICHPNSPSGTPVPMDQLRDLARRLPGLLVVDEAYVDFAGATALPLVDEFDNVVVLRTFSKSFSLAGMRIGLAFAAAPLIAQFMKVKDSYNLSRLAIVAGTAALEDYAWMKANVARVCTARDTLIRALRALRFDVLPSQTNFILARRPGKRLEPVYTALKEKGILVRYFDTPDLFDALRITVGRDEECEALVAALQAIDLP